MKITILALIVLTFGLYNTSIINAQDYDQAITADAVSLLFNTASINYEIELNQTNSIVPSFIFKNYDKWKGIGFGANYRWYVLQNQDKIISGFSFGPAFSVIYWDYEHDRANDGLGVAVGIEAQYKFVFSNIVVEPKINISYLVQSINLLEYKPFTIGINLGYAW